MANKLLILMYHRVFKEYDPFRPGDITAQIFDAHMQVLSRYFTVLPLSEAVAKLKEGSLNKNTVSITFDDGYKDNYEVALPILKKYKLPATFFIATKFIASGMMWNDEIIESIKNHDGDALNLESIGLGKYTITTIQDKRTAIEKIISKLKYLQYDDRAGKVAELKGLLDSKHSNHIMMNAEQLKSLIAGNMELGAHTVTHPILLKLSADNAKNEIVESKKYLENIVKKPIELFAYPNGRFGVDFNDEHMDIVKAAGFKSAVSTDSGVATSKDNQFRLKRFSPWDKSKLKLAVRLKLMFYFDA